MQVLSTLKVDNIDAFLPPGYKKVSSTTTESSTSTEKDFKLDISKLFSSIESDDVSSFLPPGFNKDDHPETPRTSSTTTSTESTSEETTENKLVFPTRPGMTKKTPKPNRRKPSGPPPVVPKIKSFADRYASF